MLHKLKPHRVAKSLSWRWASFIKNIRKEIPLRIYRILNSLPSVRLEAVTQESVRLERLILQDICLPPFKGPRTHDDITPLLTIAQSVNPEIIVELGTAHGNTVANLAHLFPKSHIYTVNAPVEDQSGELTTYELTKEEIGQVYRKYTQNFNITQIYANTLNLDLSPYLLPNSVDFAIVDACHDTDYVINDFMKVYPYMSLKGVILLHDTHPSMKGHLEGSYRACVNLRRKGFDIRHISNTWWAIWSPSLLSTV